jgi:L1 cell adhesion molecule like protein
MYRAENRKQMQNDSCQKFPGVILLQYENCCRGENLKDKICECDKNTVLDQFNESIRCLNANRLAYNEDFETQQLVMESVCNPIVTKMYQGAGGMPGGMPGGLQGTGGLASCFGKVQGK